jgi:hypothetical protein
MTAKRRPRPAIPGIEDFQPRLHKPYGSPAAIRKVIDEVSQFPSREAVDDDQINIKGPRAVLDRFRNLRKSERYKYADLLSMMMDAFEDAKKRA